MAENTQLNLFGSRFDRRFLEDYIGKSILNDPKIALIELIANAWDANASEVKIVWPDENSSVFSIEDNGCGLTEQEFNNRWMVLSYDREHHQGIWADFPARLEDIGTMKKRRVFGRNGKGRHGAFCFSEDGYELESWKNGRKIKYRIFIPADGMSPIASKKISEAACDPKSSGTKIVSSRAMNIGISAEDMRTVVGMRFLSDPDFKVWIGRDQITFNDVPSQNVTEYTVPIDGGATVTLIKIDVKESDKTTRQHGIAWQVHGRLVGNVDWHSLGDKSFIDGRKAAAKRFSFIVKADSLAEFVDPDWMGFKKKEPAVDKVLTAVGDKIREILFEASKQQREETFSNIVSQNEVHIANLAPIERQVWELAVKKIQHECPSLSDQDIEHVSAILVRMEASRSKYALLNKLHACSSDDIDALDKILATWTVESAKVVLNELETRLKLIDELAKKTNDKSADELKDLQPLFEKGLWIFGPEYEAVGFTSNRTMATVIKDIFHKDVPGSAKRPDFVITPDSSLGFYSYPSFDFETGEELTTGRLVIVELKAPDVSLGLQETGQCWKYIGELLDKGLINKTTPVTCYVLGRTAQRHYSEAVKHGENVVIIPLTYDVILSKAKNRTHKLYDLIKGNAPFLADEELSAMDTLIEVVNEVELKKQPLLTVEDLL